MVTTIPRYVAEIRPYFETSDADLLKVVLNSTSSSEASFALEVLRDFIPKKSLVTAMNLREVMKELPSCPICMGVDFATLAGIWDLEREDNSYRRSFRDPGGDFDVIPLGEGNLCYDIALHTDDRTLLWMPDAPREDFVNAEVMNLIMSRETLLETVADLVLAMGLPFSPRFYLSLDDWRLEHIEGIIAEIDATFRQSDDD